VAGVVQFKDRLFDIQPQLIRPISWPTVSICR
jgi:hypothetical protein